MTTSKKILSGITALILTIAVFLIGISLTITGTFSTTQPAKTALADSGLYEKFIDNAVRDAGGYMDILYSHPPLREEMINAALPALREDMEQGIDSLHAWVKDSSHEIELNVSAEGAREPVSTAVGTFVQNMIDELPVCQSIPSSLNPQNPFTWECRPSQVNSAEVNELFKDAISQERFWTVANYSMDDLFGITEEELAEDYDFIPAAYNAAVVANWILAIVIILGLAALWGLGQVKNVLRTGGISFIVGGVLLIGATIAASVATGIATEEFSTTKEFEIALSGMTTGYGGIATAWLLWSGIITIVLGIAGVVGSILINKKGRNVVSAQNGTTPPTTTPPQL